MLWLGSLYFDLLAVIVFLGVGSFRLFSAVFSDFRLFSVFSATRSNNLLTIGSHFSQKISLHVGDLDPLLTHGSLGPANDILIISAIFAGLTNMIKRQIERASERMTTLLCV